jgi:hypothetical protein
MDWVKLAESHPVIVSAVAGFAGGILAFLSTTYAARLGFRAEVMKLRHAIAERRVKEFGDAAQDLLGMALEISRGGPFHYVKERWEGVFDRFPGAGARVASTAELAMQPNHVRALCGPLAGLVVCCEALRWAMAEAAGDTDNRQRSSDVTGWSERVAGTGGALVTRHYMTRGHHLRPKAGMYVVSAHCTNCSWEGEVQVPKGLTVESVPCPRCELMVRPERAPGTGVTWGDAYPHRAGRIPPPAGAPADLVGRSSLVTQDKWEEGRAGIGASGGRR